MPFDQLKQLADQLKNLETELAQRMDGPPFEGFAGHMQTFQDELRQAAAEVAEEERAEAAADQAAQAEADKPAEPSLEEILAGGELCRGIAHIRRAVPSNPGPETLRPDIRTPMVVVEQMLSLAGVSNKDVVYDLGCGDGRVPVVAAERFGARGVGIELIPERARLAQLHVDKKNLGSLVTIEEGDVLKRDLSEATVVTLFISKGIMLRLRDRLRQQLPVGARILGHGFDMGDWKPRKARLIKDELGIEHRLFLWLVDERCKSTRSFIDDWEEWDDWVLTDW